MQKLPLVSEVTSDALMESVKDQMTFDLTRWMKTLKEENAQVAEHISEWLKGLPGAALASDHERGRLIIGPLMVYMLLRSQLAADNAQSV
jgi:hypothetical protein